MTAMFLGGRKPWELPTILKFEPFGFKGGEFPQMLLKLLKFI